MCCRYLQISFAQSKLTFRISPTTFLLSTIVITDIHKDIPPRRNDVIHVYVFYYMCQNVIYHSLLICLETDIWGQGSVVFLRSQLSYITKMFVNARKRRTTFMPLSLCYCTRHSYCVCLLIYRVSAFQRAHALHQEQVRTVEYNREVNSSQVWFIYTAFNPILN